jgi:hypothetical protein
MGAEPLSRFRSRCVRLACLVVVVGAMWHVQGRATLARVAGELCQDRPDPRDFVQNWIAGRDYFASRSTYSPIPESVDWHRRAPGNVESPPYHLPVNAHPPFATLLSIPFGAQPYPTATREWNALNLLLTAAAVVLIARELFPGSPGAWVVLGAGVATSSSLLSQAVSGNWNGVLLALLTLAWVLNRRGASAASGAAAAVAVLIKLFPAALVLHYLGLRNRRAAFAMGGGVLAGTALTLGTLGVDDHRTFVTKVTPENRSSYATGANVSVPAIGCRVFAGPTDPAVRPLVNDARLAVLAAGVPVVLLVASYWHVFVARGRAASPDLSFAACVCLMLLACPITWNQSLLLAVLPAAILWETAGDLAGRLALAFCTAVVWAHPAAVWQWRLGIQPPYGPADSVTYLAVKTYAVLGLYLLTLRYARAGRGRCPGGQ